MDGEVLAEACRRELGSPATYEAPRGYDGLALAILDAIWSMGVRYRGVHNVIVNYEAWVQARGGDPRTRTASELVVDMEQAGGAERFASEVVGNRQLTSTRGGILKAEAVEAACRALVRLGIDTAADLVAKATDPAVREAWTSVHGQRSGISFRYVLMNVRADDVKPDRMICRFVGRALGTRVPSPEAAHAAVVSAFEILRLEAPGLSLRALDHRIWRHESGRT